MLRPSRFALLALLTVPALTACSGWMGEKEAPPLPGERVAVLAFDQQLKADPSLTQTPPKLPQAVSNPLWAVAGGTLDHAGGAYALADAPAKAWQTSIGTGTDDDRPLMSTPLVVNNTLYTLDSGSHLAAHTLETGKTLWEVELAPRRTRDAATGGGLAFTHQALYATLGYGEVVALDPTNGKEMWRTALRSPLRSAPSADDSHVYVVTIDNQLMALDATTGAVVWTHSGIAEAAGLLGAPAAAVNQEAVVVAYSSGELYALRPANGRELWTDNLTSTRHEGGVMSIAAIRGMPALTPDGSTALAISNSGRLVAIDVRSGQRLWDQRMGGNQMPWIAGDTVYLVNSMAQLTALNLRDGRVRWITQLAQWENAEERDGLIAWYGPVLAGGKLWLTNSVSRLIAYDPVNGTELTQRRLGAPTNRPPVVAAQTLFTLDDEARLTAWR